MLSLLLHLAFIAQMLSSNYSILKLLNVYVLLAESNHLASVSFVMMIFVRLVQLSVFALSVLKMLRKMEVESVNVKVDSLKMIVMEYINNALLAIQDV